MAERDGPRSRSGWHVGEIDEDGGGGSAIRGALVGGPRRPECPGASAEGAEEHDAYAALRDDPELARHVETLRGWFLAGPPASRIYAAVLLAHLDMREGRAALMLLRAAKEPVTLQVGPGAEFVVMPSGQAAQIVASHLGAITLRLV